MAARVIEALPVVVVEKSVGEMTISELATAIERRAMERVLEGLDEELSTKDPQWMSRLTMAATVMRTIAAVQAETMRHAFDAAGWRAFAKSAAEFEKKLYAGDAKGKKPKASG